MIAIRNTKEGDNIAADPNNNIKKVTHANRTDEPHSKKMMEHTTLKTMRRQDLTRNKYILQHGLHA